MPKLIRKHKKYLIFVLTVVLVGIVVGFIYANLQSGNIKANIINTLEGIGTFRYNAIFKDLIIMSLLLVSSFLIIGLPLCLFYLFYEGISLGFLISIFMMTFKIKGLIYILIYLLFNKIITLFIMFFFLKHVINIGRYVIGLIIYKKDSLIKEKIFLNFMTSLKYIIVLFVINIILYFLSYFLMSKFSFLLN